MDFSKNINLEQYVSDLSDRSTSSEFVGDAISPTHLEQKSVHMSPEKQSKLRNFLINRRVTPVQCKNTSGKLAI